MHDVKWVIFDVGGVLLDWQSSSQALAGYLRVDKDILMETMFRQAPLMNVGKLSPQDGWAIIIKELGKTEDPQEIIRRWRARDFWIQDTLKLLRELDRAGYNLGILSNSWLGLTNKEERNTLPPEIGLFKFILDSSQEGIKKPNPLFYERTEQESNALSSELLFIDDDAGNLPPAEQRGWNTFHFVLGQDGGLVSNNSLRQKLLNS